MTEQFKEAEQTAPEEKTILLNEDFKMPAELRALPPRILPVFLPDLSVTAVMAEGGAQVTHCHRVTFQVHYKPGIFILTRPLKVKVRVIDEIFGVPEIVGEVLLLVPPKGGVTQAGLEWPMPADASFTPDFNNKIQVIVDPDHEIMERDETNNICTVVGTCLG